MAIRSFGTRSLQRLFERGRLKGIPSDVAAKLTALLDHLDAARALKDLDIAGFHALKGDRKGTYAWKVTANWRLTFRFENGDVFDVSLEDYH